MALWEFVLVHLVKREDVKRDLILNTFAEHLS